MNDILYSIIGILIPFIGTTLGSFIVFFINKDLNSNLKKIIIGFAAGVMIAASVWSLIIPAIEMSKEQGYIPWLPPTIGLLIGALFLLTIYKLTNNIKNKGKDKKLNMLLFSVTLHNIPEGMAVGVCFAAFLTPNSSILLLEAMILSLGIAIQNIPEGAIISMPLKLKGTSKLKSFWYGLLSGIVEPIAALITILLTNIIVPILPYLLSFAAGAMLFVVSEELIPEMHENNKNFLGTIGLTIGFIVMMILDVALS